MLVILNVNRRLSWARRGRNEYHQRVPSLRDVFSNQIPPVPRAGFVKKDIDILIVIGKEADIQKSR